MSTRYDIERISITSYDCTIVNALAGIYYNKADRTCF